MSNPVKLIWKDKEALSRAAAYYFVEACAKSIAASDRFTVAFSGGSTPKRLFEILTTPEFSNNIEWKKVFIFWSDERFVPHTSDDSNYKMSKLALLDHIKIPKKNIFATPTKGEPAACAAEYEAAVKTVLGKTASFDLTLLGMGDDGHTASLFPGTTILTETKRLVKEVWVESKQTWRISFTYTLINKSKEVLLLVGDANKYPVLKKIFAKNAKPVYPVQGINPQKGRIIWLLDEAAVTGK
ncbi:6-phosphogluconolactonase [Niabella ginsenosidivorans]|uniref:6-phosphogluconolactonase n=1 Tax=Niabella ginsenosidivorans TaxID=1176587 RepID=A0A1A9I5H6_9BACT|nr:6-phosphogluconolactonase [Niabella ginsenosidivorans]ANH82813.1 6-phosphogluconolactonase [Niabella ginsenosidivorans]